MSKFPLTQKMIDEAKTAEDVRAPFELSCSWLRHSEATDSNGNTIICELHIFWNRQTEQREVGLTRFHAGANVISRKRAEALLTPH